MRVVLIALVVLVARPLVADACGWDRDTLAMETRKFPGVVPLITGGFLHHSDEFYRWRIEDRKRQLVAGAKDLALYDDLGVALDKVGEHKQAIEAMRQKGQLQPGLYETHANWGTFLIHDGQLAAGLVHIKRAIEINPNAHFGREVIQQRLVEYLLELEGQRSAGEPMRCAEIDCDLLAERSRAIDSYLRGDSEGRASDALQQLGVNIGGTLGVARSKSNPLGSAGAVGKPLGFARYLAERGHSRDEGIQGVTGMMKFGNYRSPVLLEALGDVLLWPQGEHTGHQIASPARRLAARAYLAAAARVEAQSADAARLYRSLALVAFDWQPDIDWGKVHRAFRREQRAGARFARRVHADEKRWIRRGKNPEALFERKYYERTDAAKVEPEARAPAASTPKYPVAGKTPGIAGKVRFVKPGESKGLTPEQILSVVKAEQARIKACYERRLREVPTLAGKTEFRWKILPDGAVTKVELVAATMNDVTAETCIGDVLETLKFPPSSNGKPSIVTFPFIFGAR